MLGMNGDSFNNETKVSIVPKPASYKTTDGMFELNINSRIVVTNGSLKCNVYEEIKQNVAEYLANILRTSTGYNIDTIISDCTYKPLVGDIVLNLLDYNNKEEESYELSISSDYISIRAFQPAGLFRGIQTLRQLFDVEIENKTPVHNKKWSIACAEIKDSPIYPYRGLMIDIARHFFPKEAIMRQIDYAALYKINKLHLHLTDDQGWRIEVKSRPALTEIGSLGAAYGDSGGYLTQNDFIEIVEYAAKQYIEVIPEIDMPGHVHAALASIPELNPNSLAAIPRTDVKVGLSQFMCRSEETYRFIDDVIREIAAISPSKYFHIGGDEADKTSLSDYEYFMKRAAEIIKKYGKTTVGWNPYDCTNAIYGDAIVQNWFMPEDSLYYPKIKNLKVILSPAGAYLDQKYNKKTKIGFKWRGFINLDKAYSWYPSIIAPSVNVYGVESTLWTETIVTEDDMDYMLYPRLLANAEIGWTAEENRVYSDFIERLPKQFDRLDKLNIKYCKDFD